MSPTSSSGESWSSRLEPPRPHEVVFQRADDPRLAELIVPWRGNAAELVAGRAVLVGFPQDEGVRRNSGRPGAADAPAEIRRWLGRLTPYDPAADADLARPAPLDLGNVRLAGPLEATQEALGEVVAAVLGAGSVPVVLGGGHETALGCYLGHARTGRDCAIVNLDAHLDLRPFAEGRGHSGSPFRQAIEHPTTPLPGHRYVCLGAQPHAVARAHLEYARRNGCTVVWRDDCAGQLAAVLERECRRLEGQGCRIHLTVDADAVDASVVPGVSAPNPNGLAAGELLACAARAGQDPAVASLDVVEVNPRLDRDGQSARWAALLVWHFLSGLARRS